MNWITGIQRAIDYIEDHRINKIDYEEVGKCAYSSSFHFQRVFSVICGYTVGEYVRNRRLSLAGEELANPKSKIIYMVVSLSEVKSVVEFARKIDKNCFVNVTNSNQVYGRFYIKPIK